MILMVGTSAPGGINEVMRGYERDGLFEKWSIRRIDTHCPGSLATRLGAAMKGFGKAFALLATGKVDAIHAHAAMRGSFWRKSILVLAGRLFRIPVLLHLHGSEMKQFYAEQPRWAQAVIRATLRQARVVIVLSSGWERYIAEIAPGTRLVVLPNYSVPVPTGPAEAQAGDKPRFVFLFLGALIDRKGVYELLPAFAALEREFDDVELWMGGRGEDAKVQALMASLGLGRVRLLGWVAGEEKTRLLQTADAFVLPSKNENLPLSIVEAMSAGLPVISTRVGGIPEMFSDSVQGLLIEPGSIEQLLAAMRSLRADPERARAMGARAMQNYRSRFSQESVIPQLECLYAASLHR